MNVPISRQFCRIASLILITSAISLTATGGPEALADDIDCGNTTAEREISSSSQSEPSPDAVVPFESELCGWVTHDSCPAPYRQIATRTSCAFDESIAAAAATACATARISVEQIVEPFAMVGPHVSDSMQRVREFQEWWQTVIAEAEKAQAAPQQLSAGSPSKEPSGDQSGRQPSDGWSELGESFAVQVVEAPPVAEARPVVEGPQVVEQRIDRLALEEPVDTDRWGVSVLVRDDQAFVGPRPDTVAIPDAAVAQVGASPVIVSFDDTYWPYDLSARDLRVWSVFPLVTEPFCIRSRRDTQFASHSWDDLDQATTERIIAQSTTTAVDAPTPAHQIDHVIHHAVPIESFVESSAECLLDNLAWSVSDALDEYQELTSLAKPRGIGQQIAAIAIRLSRVAGTATVRIAGIWPEAPPVVEAKPRTAGELLLARAGAVEAGEPIAEKNEASPVAAIAEASTNLRR